MHAELLEWCSEREEGTIAAFERAHAWLVSRTPRDQKASASSLSLYRLQVLGHLEVDWKSSRWAVTPSTITIIDRSGGNALLVGARPRWLQARLLCLESDPDPVVRDQISPFVVEARPIVQPEAAPSAMFLSAPSDDLLQLLCERLQIRFEQRAEARLRQVLPLLDSYLHVGWKESPPPGFEPARFQFSANRIGFEPTSDDTEPGAYEYKGYGPARYFFKDADGDLAQSDKWIVVYAELRRLGRNVLYYDARAMTLLTPAKLPLPLLYARCAVLRSGLLPRFRRERAGVPVGYAPWLEYDNIPAGLALKIANQLGQTLQTARS